MKKNQENISKHDDAYGIYARICLLTCESKLSQVLNIFSQRYRKRYRLASRKTTALRACKNLILNKHAIKF
jgi:hypothetical protein